MNAKTQNNENNKLTFLQIAGLLLIKGGGLVILSLPYFIWSENYTYVMLLFLLAFGLWIIGGVAVIINEIINDRHKKQINITNEITDIK